LLDGYVPQPSDVIVAVAAGVVSGRFANPPERVFTSAGAFDVSYSATEVILSGFDPEATPPTPTVGTPGTVTPGPSHTPPTSQPVTASPTPPPTPTPAPRVGDCDRDGRVAVHELVSGVSIALGETRLESCPAFDTDSDGVVSVAEVVTALGAALDECS
jgi:hypothetical protein